LNPSDFYFDLPPELIAQTPLARRDASRLLLLPRAGGKISHRRFCDLAELLKPGDCLVLNDSRVLPARLLGARETGGAAELVLLRDRGEAVWECLARPGKKLRPGALLSFGGGELTARVEAVIEGGNRLVRFFYDGIFLEVLERLGKMPLPPYIHEDLEDSERYQTVYSREPGSAAAPTAGLHFTPELLDSLRGAGVRTAFVTLHVGLGTFRPVKAAEAENHEMHAEYCALPPETAAQVNETRARGGRVIAVGTTSCRTLESAAGLDGASREFSGFTDIFIYPGYKFRCIDGLLTNFHLPESTLLMLVSALAGRERVLDAYRAAVEECYRFFSFGDAMLII
jgi:S-adenosylmethionine:tRNA ribosyltransferase-isomerase